MPLEIRSAILKNGLTLKMDRAGRIILPKSIRDRLGLLAGSELEVLETPDGVALRPAERRSSLVREGRFLVHTGKLPAGYDILMAIDGEREDQMRKVWGA